MEQSWVDKVSANLDEQIDLHIAVRDYRFYQLAQLKRFAYHLDKKKTLKCGECEFLKKDLESLINDLDRLLNKNGNNKKEFEQRVLNIVSHLKKEHEVYYTNYFAYTYSTIAVGIGLLVSVLLSLAIFATFNGTFISLLMGVFVVGGYFYGSNKDGEIRRADRLL